MKNYAMKNTSTLSADHRLTIPKTVRSVYQGKAGQKFAFIPKGSGVLLVRIPERHEQAGIAKGANPTNYRDR